jgi:hypothetical protein
MSQKLISVVNKLESYFEHFEKANTAISKQNVAWHLDHSFRVLNGIATTLINSKPEDYKPNFNLKRIVVFINGKIPRGTGNAPKVVQAENPVMLSELQSWIIKVRPKLESLSTLNPKSNFNHPSFGQLNLKQSIRLLEIHTNHHIEIVKDLIQ